jgi:hypothetical protein
VRLRARGWACCAWLLVWSAGAAAQSGNESSWDADDTVGFGSEPAAQPNAGAPAQPASDAAGSDGARGFTETQAPPSAEASEPSPWSLSASLRARAGFWTSASHPSRLASARPSLDARLSYRKDPLESGSSLALRLVAAGHIEYDFAYLVNRDAYDQATLDTYEWQFIGREMFAALRVADFELSVGRQIANWGEGEALSVLDVVNPRDLREPGLADIADLRLAVLMTRASLSIARHKLEFLIVHEPYFGLVPPPLGVFSPLRALLLESPQFANALAGHDVSYRQIPAHVAWEPQATQYHARWSVSGEGFDLALQAASLLDGLGVPVLPEPQAFARQNIALPLIHPRYELLGQSGAVPIGAFLLRWEGALEWQRPLTVRRLDTPVLDLSAERHTRITGLLGLTYFASGTTTAALEVTQSYVFDAPEHRSGAQVASLWPVEKPQFALRLDYRFFRERAYLSALLLVIGLKFDSVMARAELGYAINDAWKAALGGIVYAPGSEFGPFYGFVGNDQIFIKLQCDLALL